MDNPMVALSNQLSAAVDRIAGSVVAVHAGPRFASSGVVLRPGVIVTADHALKHDEELKVTLPDGRPAAVTVAGRDPGTDLAVLKIDDATLPAASIAEAPAVKPGNMVLAVGRTAETGVNATLGIISAVGPGWRTWRGGQVDQYIRLDLTLYFGSSGGAVVDAAGQVVGIATNVLSRIAPLAVPASTVNRVVDEILSRGRVARGYLGVGLQPIGLPEHLKKQLNLSQATGLIVLSVEPGGPAEDGGILIGDILVDLGGRPVTDTDDVQAVLGGESVGTTLAARVVRGGTAQELSIRIGERPQRRG